MAVISRSSLRATLRSGFVLLAVVVVMPISAGELSRFNSAVAGFSENLRAAAFYLHTSGTDGPAGFEIERMGSRWQAVVEAFAAHPPDAFADDPDWRGTLDRVSVAAAEAERSVAAGNAPAARAALERARTDLATLRQRNGVRVFADDVSDLDSVMDRLYVLRHAPPDLTDTDAVNALKSDAAVAAYLLARCLAQAPAAAAEDGQLRRLVEESLASLRGLVSAADAGDSDAVVRYLRELRSFQGMLRLGYG